MKQNLRMSSAEPLIQLREVVKSYPTAGGELVALNGITADFHQGQFAGIFGKSGAGKSTLVNMITGVDHLTSGEVRIGGTSVHELDESQMALWRGRNVGVVYQTFELLPTLSLIDNVMLPMDFCGLYLGRQSAERATELLTQVGRPNAESRDCQSPGERPTNNRCRRAHWQPRHSHSGGDFPPV